MRRQCNVREWPHLVVVVRMKSDVALVIKCDSLLGWIDRQLAIVSVCSVETTFIETWPSA